MWLEPLYWGYHQGLARGNSPQGEVVMRDGQIIGEPKGELLDF